MGQLRLLFGCNSISLCVEPRGFSLDEIKVRVVSRVDYLYTAGLIYLFYNQFCGFFHTLYFLSGFTIRSQGNSKLRTHDKC